MFKPIHLIPENTSINFLSLKSIFLSISLFVVLISLIASWIIGLNFGIDFRGGVLLELRSKNGFANIAELRSKLNRFDLGEVSIQEFGKPTDALIRIQKQDGDEKSQDAKLNKVKEKKEFLFSSYSLLVSSEKLDSSFSMLLPSLSTTNISNCSSVLSR